MVSGDTIAAVATPPGAGGISVIRVSGPRAGEIATRLFRSDRGVREFRSHRLYHGHVVKAETGAILDEVLIALMHKPHSYTGEDTLEISCHGGRLVTQAILDEVFRAGACPALPGEFSKRAFFNNRMDLAQAEAVADVVLARTERGLAAALAQLRGGLSGKVEALGAAMNDILATLERFLDFDEEEREQLDRGSIVKDIDGVVSEVDVLLATCRRGEMLRNGVRAAIIGRPNVGKSSLLNALLGRRRAIVTSIPGTTRDFIEEYLDVGGIAVTVTDTAGIRQPEDVIEEEGIRAVWEYLETTDLVLVVLDGSAPLSDEDREVIAAAGERAGLVVINKTDLARRLDDEELCRILPTGMGGPLFVSAKYGDGIADLLGAVAARVTEDPAEGREDIVITNTRHRWALEQTRELMVQARAGIAGGTFAELAAFDIRQALAALGEIRGMGASDEVLERIFARFCIGK